MFVPAEIQRDFKFPAKNHDRSFQPDGLLRRPDRAPVPRGGSAQAPDLVALAAARKVAQDRGELPGAQKRVPDFPVRRETRRVDVLVLGQEPPRLGHLLAREGHG